MDTLYISIIREFRGATGGKITGFIFKFMRPVFLLGAFYVIYEIVGRLPVIRGDFMLYLLTGIFLYLAHIQAVKQIKGMGHNQAGMMFYAKTSTLVNIMSTAINEAYILAISIILILLVIFLYRGELDIYNPPGLLAPLALAWASGLAVGLLFMAFTPFAPGIIPGLYNVYRRLQMITSGKMFVANSLPLATLPFFSWNPLFHTIDQARGETFVNYTPMRTNIEYPLQFTVVAITLALIVEFALRIRSTRGVE
ncbi:ABC transporter permease [Pontivivens insulae]|uniref:Polysialic acid transport protein KpsM n=2 Tax=Pontivivens insulae TaxID=1639689 RepID=A0A2R8A831_9RHOB|nr:ABC transporter permease [Pontivivens insulae]RED18499.1 ABC-type polysaccharide/polyol phosphate export permease [Pontivivens insulae]SPF28397.1 hypothetical protein POI8812_00696 [Pontivivens insulae]